MKIHVGNTLAIFVVSIFILLIVPMVENVLAFTAYPADSSAYGYTYKEWTAKWWTWALSIPKNISPLEDNSGIHCMRGQSGPVWFLAGTTGGSPIVRTCVVPGNKAILFPVINNECSTAEYPSSTTDQLRSCAVTNNNNVNLQVTVDGVALKSSEMPRLLTPLFDVVFPAGNIFGAPAGPAKAISDGFWVFLAPLAPGDHQIHIKAVPPGGLSSATTMQSSQIISYNLKVQ